jgi:hypothetical protein
VRVQVLVRVHVAAVDALVDLFEVAPGELRVARADVVEPAADLRAGEWHGVADFPLGSTEVVVAAGYGGELDFHAPEHAVIAEVDVARSHPVSWDKVLKLRGISHLSSIRIL